MVFFFKIVWKLQFGQQQHFIDSHIGGKRKSHFMSALKWQCPALSPLCSIASWFCFLADKTGSTAGASLSCFLYTLWSCHVAATLKPINFLISCLNICIPFLDSICIATRTVHLCSIQKVLLHDAHLVRASICWVSWSEQWTDGVTCIYSCDISKGAMKPNCPALVCSLQRISHWWFVVTLRTHRKQHIWVQCNRVLCFPFSFAASWLQPKYAVISVARLGNALVLSDH